ncbi:hypothetical protein F2P79_008677 [Pimephales promelas]|nr:hypothetical protein F2P79_008677 [Pimephales promelas]
MPQHEEEGKECIQIPTLTLGTSSLSRYLSLPPPSPPPPLPSVAQRLRENVAHCLWYSLNRERERERERECARKVAKRDRQIGLLSSLSLLRYLSFSALLLLLTSMEGAEADARLLLNVNREQGGTGTRLEQRLETDGVRICFVHLHWCLEKKSSHLCQVSQGELSVV